MARARGWNLISNDELHDLYVLRKMSTMDISKIIGCSQSAVVHYLRRYNIPARDFKSASRMVSWKISLARKGKKIKQNKTPEQIIHLIERNISKAKPIGSKRMKKGYILIKTEDGWMLEHRVVYSKFLGNRLPSKIVIHHKNGNKTDNSIENLEVMTNGEHTIHHHLGKKRSKITCHNISKSLKNRLKQNIEGTYQCVE